jgi:hypothetical protein
MGQRRPAGRLGRARESVPPRRRRCADVEKAGHRLGYSRACVRQVLVEGRGVEITQPFTEKNAFEVIHSWMWRFEDLFLYLYPCTAQLEKCGKTES